MVCLILGYAYSTRNDLTPQMVGIPTHRKSKNSSYRAKATRAFGNFLKWCNYHAFLQPDPTVETQAIMRGMNFLRGRLGNTGFRQQYVNDGRGGYSRQTVAFTMPTGNSSNTVLQSAQRSRFRLLTILGSALSRCGILRQWYYSGIGISGYNAFMRDNLRNEAVVTHSNGEQFIDWTKVIVAIGSGFQKILPFKSGLTPSIDYDPSCESVVQLRWGTQCVCKSPEDRDNYALILVGVKVNVDGTLEDVCYKQPGATLANCSIEVKLPICDCCKTYWFAFFANPYNGDNTHSVYLGPDTNFGNLPMHDPETCCFKCEETADSEELITAPDEIPVFCGCGHDDHEAVDREAIIFNGERNFGVGYGITPVNLLDAGTNDGSGVEPDSDPGIIVYTINGATCPIDFANTKFDLSLFGLSNTEMYADGDSLAAAIETALGDGSWTYNNTNCTLEVTGGSQSGGDIAAVVDDDTTGGGGTSSMNCNYSSGKTNMDGSLEVIVGGFSIDGNQSPTSASHAIYTGGIWDQIAADAVMAELTTALENEGFTVNSLTLTDVDGSAQYDLSITGDRCPDIIIRTMEDNDDSNVTLSIS